MAQRRKTDPPKRGNYEKRTSYAEMRKAIKAAHERLCGPMTARRWNGTSPKVKHPGKEDQPDQVGSEADQP